MIVAVVARPVKEVDHASRHACRRPVETVIDAHLQPSHVEIVEIVVEGCVSIPRLEVSVVFFSESLSEEISNVSKNYENEVGDVGCKEVIIRWLVHHRFREFSALVPACVSVCLRIERPKLGVLPCQSASLRRGRRLEECGRRLVHVGRISCCRRERNSR